eukprot:1032097-Rhodomonas_salina.4
MHPDALKVQRGKLSQTLEAGTLASDDLGHSYHGATRSKMLEGGWEAGHTLRWKRRSLSCAI